MYCNLKKRRQIMNVVTGASGQLGRLVIDELLRSLPASDGLATRCGSRLCR